MRPAYTQSITTHTRLLYLYSPNGECTEPGEILLRGENRRVWGDSVAEWLACWTQAQKCPGKLFTPIVPLFTKQQNW